jgi:hypothetical protein
LKLVKPGNLKALRQCLRGNCSEERRRHSWVLEPGLIVAGAGLDNSSRGEAVADHWIPHKYFVNTSIQPAMENAPTQYEAINPELAVSGVALKLFRKRPVKAV